MSDIGVILIFSYEFSAKRCRGWKGCIVNCSHLDGLEIMIPVGPVNVNQTILALAWDIACVQKMGLVGERLFSRGHSNNHRVLLLSIPPIEPKEKKKKKKTKDIPKGQDERVYIQKMSSTLYPSVLRAASFLGPSRVKILKIAQKLPSPSWPQN